MFLRKRIGAAIFDMDGLLIDSEPYWKIAEQKVFGSLGLELSNDLLKQVMGFRLSEVVEHWFNYQSWPNPDFKKTELNILNTVKELIWQHANAMPGVYELLNHLKRQNIPMAIASSSNMELIEIVADKLKIKDYFQVLHSAQFEPFGKPHPGIFISTAAKLGVEPKDCLVFEDSINGVIAAKAARMKCIAVPETPQLNDSRFAIADACMPSLSECLKILI